MRNLVRALTGRGARRRTRALPAAATLLALLAVAPPALANSPSGDGAVIDNGAIQLGINDLGNLNFLPSDGVVPSQEGVDVVGLRFLRGTDLAPLEATADGCTCEGWGIADAGSGVTGYANDADGYRGLNLVSFTHDATTATSVVETSAAVTDGGGFTALDVAPGSTPRLRVMQEYAPAPETPFLYRDKVTVTNIGDVAANDLRYRRVMDWDVEPTAFEEYSTIDGTDATSLLFSSDNGFDTADPLGTRGYYEQPQCSGTDDGSTNACTGFFTDAGPYDHGAHFDFGFGALAPGESKSFTVLYGAAGSESEATDALKAVNAEVFSLGQASTEDGPTLGTPATFIFGFTTRTASDLEGAAPSMTLAAPPTVGLDADGNPSAFDVTANLHNYGAKTASDLKAAIGLPAGLSLVSGDPSAALGDLASGADAATTWHVKPEATCRDATYRIGASATWTEGSRPLSSSRAVTVHGTCGRVFGAVTGFDRSGMRGMSGAQVDLCPATGDCATPVDTTTTSGTGRYEFSVADPGDYRVIAHPVAPFDDPATKTSSVLTVAKGSDVQQDFGWEIVDRVDSDTSLAGPGYVSRCGGAGEPACDTIVPTLYWEAETTVTKDKCPDGTTGEQSARYRIVSDTETFQDWTDMPIQGDGSFRAVVPALSPHHGDAHFEFEVTCGSTITPSGFDVYIDPSGVVVDQDGKPVRDAKVTLYRFQGAALGYVPVPDGSTVMSPANRTNPDRTDRDGHFGWDVVAGGYVVRAEKAGCRSPSNAAVPYAESATLTIPPAVTDLRLVLDCTDTGSGHPGTTPAGNGQNAPASGSSTTQQGPTAPGPAAVAVAASKPVATIASAGKVRISRRGQTAQVRVSIRAARALKGRLVLIDRRSHKRLGLVSGTRVGKQRLRGHRQTFAARLGAGSSAVTLAARSKSLRRNRSYALKLIVGSQRVLVVPFRG